MCLYMEKKSEFYCENQTYTEPEKALHTNSIKYFCADLFCIQRKIINSLQIHKPHILLMNVITK